jgi:hypothetical protein
LRVPTMVRSIVHKGERYNVDEVHTRGPGLTQGYIVTPKFTDQSKATPLRPLRPTPRRLRMRRKSNSRKPKWGFKLDHLHQRRLEIRCLCHAPIVTHRQDRGAMVPILIIRKTTSNSRHQRLKLTRRAARTTPRFARAAECWPMHPAQDLMVSLVTSCPLDCMN